MTCSWLACYITQGTTGSMLAWHKLAFPSWFSCVRLLPEPRATKTLIAGLVLRSVALLLLLCALLPTVELLVLAFPAHRSSSLCPVCLLLGDKRSFVFLVRFVKCASPHRVKYMRLLTKLLTSLSLMPSAVTNPWAYVPSVQGWIV